MVAAALFLVSLDTKQSARSERAYVCSGAPLGASSGAAAGYGAAGVSRAQGSAFSQSDIATSNAGEHYGHHAHLYLHYHASYV